MRDLREGAQILVSDEIVDRGDFALGDRLAYDFGGLGLGRGGTLARFGVAEGGLAAAFGLQNHPLLGALRPEDRGLALAFRGQYFGTLLALGLHLPAHRLDKVLRRYDVLNFDAVDLDAPRRGRSIDDSQQTFVDFVTMRQHLIEFHGAHHGTDIGHRELDDGLVELRNLVACLGGVEHLKKHDAVYRNAGVVLGNDLLLRNVHHLFHHIHPATDPVDEGDDQVKAGPQHSRVAAESLNGPIIALWHRLDAEKDRENGQKDDDEDENVVAAEHLSTSPDSISSPRRCSPPR